MRLQLVHRLMLVVGCALVPVSLLQAWSTLELESRQVDATRAEALRLLALIEDRQAATIAGVRQILTVLRQTKVVIERDWDGCQDLLDRLAEELPAHLDIHVTDDRGVVRCATEVPLVGLDAAEREPLVAALGGARFAVGSHVVARTGGGPALPLAVPIRDRVTGAVVGVVAALLATHSLGALGVDEPLPPNATLTVADRTGTILARIPDVGGLTGARLPDDLMTLALQGDGGARELRDLDGTTRLVAFSPVGGGPTNLFVPVGLDQAGALSAIRRARLLTLLPLAVAAIGSVLLALWLGRQYVRAPAAHLAVVALGGFGGARVGRRERRGVRPIGH
ncbi:hypothetical protein [Skermanella stibiiresistens]|nr:hypothetical protein [Skermanella stibiiresistens]